MCCYACVYVLSDEGENGKERKRAQRRKESSPSLSTNLCLTHGRNSDRKFPFAAASGWNDKRMKKCKPEIQAFIIPYRLSSLFYSLAKYQTDRLVDSATGTAIPQETSDIYLNPYKQDLIDIKSYMAEQVLPVDCTYRQIRSSKICRNAAIINPVRCWH